MEWPGAPAISERVSAQADQFQSDIDIFKGGIFF